MKLTPLASGSKGNCFLVQAAGKNILIDAGISRPLLESLLRRRRELGVAIPDIDLVLLTHEHDDHAKYVDIFSDETFIVGTAATLLALPEDKKSRLKSAMTCNPLLPFSLGEVHIVPFPVTHYAVAPVGYKIVAEQKKFVLAHDLGTIDRNLVMMFGGCSALAIESNWNHGLIHRHEASVRKRVMSDNGHLSNSRCAALLQNIEKSVLKHVILLHVSEISNTPESARASAAAVLPKEVDIHVATPVNFSRKVIEI